MTLGLVLFGFTNHIFLGCVDPKNYCKIHNGSDIFIIDSIKKNKNYRYVHSRKFSNKSLHYENNDLYYNGKQKRRFNVQRTGITNNCKNT